MIIKLKAYPKETLCIIIAIVVYGFGVFIVGISSTLMLLLVVPTCVFSVFAFKYGKPNLYNRIDNLICLFWWGAYVILVVLTATQTLPLVNEFTNWIWIVIIPIIIVKFTNKTTIKETLSVIGLCGSAIKQPWKIKTLCLCLITAPLLIWAAHGRFDITFATVVERPTTLLFFPVMFILMMLTAGTTEEVFFRGIIQRNMYNATKSQVIAVLVSALLFALFHLPWAYFFWSHTQGDVLLSIASVMTEQFTAGIFLGVVFIRSSNLWTVIILHSFINSVWATATFFTDNPILRFG